MELPHQFPSAGLERNSGAVCFVQQTVSLLQHLIGCEIPAIDLDELLSPAPEIPGAQSVCQAGERLSSQPADQLIRNFLPDSHGVDEGSVQIENHRMKCHLLILPVTGWNRCPRSHSPSGIKNAFRSA